MPIGSQNGIAIWNSSYNPLPFFSLPQGLKVLLNSPLPLDLFIFPRSHSQRHFYCLPDICFQESNSTGQSSTLGWTRTLELANRGSWKCVLKNKQERDEHPKQNRGKECGALPVPFAATSPCLDLQIVSSLGLIPWVFQFFLNKIPN